MHIWGYTLCSKMFFLKTPCVLLCHRSSEVLHGVNSRFRHDTETFPSPNHMSQYTNLRAPTDILKLLPLNVPSKSLRK